MRDVSLMSLSGYCWDAFMFRECGVGFEISDGIGGFVVCALNALASCVVGSIAGCMG